jgi:hypothetical protein
MRNVWVLILCVVACIPPQVLAQEKNQPSAGNAALEKELFALELKWIKAEVGGIFSLEPASKRISWIRASYGGVGRGGWFPPALGSNRLAHGAGQ